jgi:serine protease inhibitor
VKVNYTEHNPSVTVSVGDNEWIEVANWVYKNWDIVGGLSFLPRSNHVYQLAPYEAITKEKYEELLKNMPELDFSKIVIYELKDETEVKKELACSSGACDLI